MRIVIDSLTDSTWHLVGVKLFQRTGYERKIVEVGVWIQRVLAVSVCEEVFMICLHISSLTQYKCCDCFLGYRRNMMTYDSTPPWFLRLLPFISYFEVILLIFWDICSYHLKSILHYIQPHHPSSIPSYPQPPTCHTLVLPSYNSGGLRLAFLWYHRIWQWQATDG